MSDIEDLLDVQKLVAPFGLRAGAWLIDAAIGYGTAMVIWLLTHNFLALLPMGFMLVRDGFSRGRSPGKKACGLQVIVSATGRPCGMKASAIRNIPFALVVPIPVELFIAALSPEGLRLGDYFAGTFVISSEKPMKPRPEPESAAEGSLHEEQSAVLADDAQSLQDVTGDEVDEVLDFGGEDDSEHSQAPAADEPSPKAGEGEGTDLDDILDFETEQGTEPVTEPQLQSVGGPDPYLTLNVPKNADRDSVEDAYWAFVDRFSDEEIRELSPEALDQRCRELSERFEHLAMSKLGVKIVYSRKMSDKEKRNFIHQHVVAINKARDSLLR